MIWHFDEIQVVLGCGWFVRRLLDAERTEVLATGSSAALLSREIATAFRGRAWHVLIHPFSFEEVLRHQAVERFPRARKRLLTLTQDGIPAESPVGTEVQTACGWLLEGAR